MDKLLPIVRRVAAKTIADDLSFYTEEEMKAVEDRILSENRDGKIDSILNNKNFTPKDIKDDEEYKRLKRKGFTPITIW